MSSKKVVLVADDEPDNIEYVRNVLADEFEVVGVPDGDAALKEAAARHPALILLDVQMLGMDGLTTFSELRKDPDTKTIPVIMFTAVTVRTGIAFSEDAVEEYVGERPEAYVEKPIDPDKLLREVRRLTGQ